MTQQIVQEVTQNYVEALRDLNTVLKPMGIQMPMPLAIKVGQKPGKGCYLVD
jgi:hypothetical protein